MNTNTTKDDEIDYAFQMARDLGVRAMSCSTTVAMAKRVAPFADKYKIIGAATATPISSTTRIRQAGNVPRDHDVQQVHRRQSRYRALHAGGLEPGLPTYRKSTTASPTHLKDSMKPDKCMRRPQRSRGAKGRRRSKTCFCRDDRRKHKFPANIELEYKTPQGSGQRHGNQRLPPTSSVEICRNFFAPRRRETSSITRVAQHIGADEFRRADNAAVHSGDSAAKWTTASQSFRIALENRTVRRPHRRQPANTRGPSWPP